jgi:hypothetical protein
MKSGEPASKAQPGVALSSSGARTRLVPHRSARSLTTLLRSRYQGAPMAGTPGNVRPDGAEAPQFRPPVRCGQTRHFTRAGELPTKAPSGRVSDWARAGTVDDCLNVVPSSRLRRPCATNCCRAFGGTARDGAATLFARRPRPAGPGGLRAGPPLSSRSRRARTRQS